METDTKRPPMEAMCPHCFGDGCDKCSDGKIAVRFNQGDWWTEKCQSAECGFENGMRIMDQGEHPSKKEWGGRGVLRPCIFCNSETKWTLVFTDF